SSDLAGFGPQVTIRVVAGDLHAGALDARDLAVGFLEDLGPVAFALAIAQIHPQQHRRPVLGLGATAARLDVDEAGVRIHRIVEDSTEFHVADGMLERIDIVGDGDKHGVVRLAPRELEELAAVLESSVEAAQRADDRFELLSLFAELLRAFRIAPDPGVLEGPRHGAESYRFGVEVKDTSADRQRAAAIRKGCWQSG